MGAATPIMVMTVSLLTGAGTTPPVCGSRAPGAGVDGCTTEGSNTHKTETREIRYRWHPWYGRQVLVESIRHRRGVVVLNCRTDDDGVSPVLEVPEWMFDSRVCSRVKQAGTATVE